MQALQDFVAGKRDLDKEAVLRNVRQLVRVLQGCSEVLPAVPFPDADDTGMGRTLREAAGATHGVINLRGKPVRAALMEVSDNVVISGFFMSLFSGTAIELSCGCSLEKKALSRGLAAISVIISSAFQPFSHAYANKWWYLRKRSTLSWLSEKCPKAAHIRMLLQILHCNDFFSRSSRGGGLFGSVQSLAIVGGGCGGLPTVALEGHPVKARNCITRLKR